MAKNALLNIGKSLFKDISEKFIQQGKDALCTAGNEIVEKGKKIVITTVNDKLSDLSSGFLGERMQQSPASFVKVPIEDSGEEYNGSEVKTTISPKTPLVAEPIYTDAKYRNAEQFENTLHGGLNGLAKGLAAGNPAAAAEVLSNLLNMAGEVSKFTEVQKTKRKEIEAQRDMYVGKINAQKEVMLAYLEKSFDERKDNFKKLFEVVDHAIANNNMHQLSISLESISLLATASPFKDLASIESTQQALTDKNHQWDF